MKAAWRGAGMRRTGADDGAASLFVAVCGGGEAGGVACAAAMGTVSGMRVATVMALKRGRLGAEARWAGF